MNNFSVIEVDDDKWSEILSKSLIYDFYHTQSYHQLEKENRPLLFVAFIKNDFIALPLIIRKIPNSIYYDCTSAYGYCGPISNIENNKIGSEVLVFFKNKLLDYFKENKIISAFSRLHPILKNDDYFLNFGEVKNINKTIIIDLKLPIDEQIKQYRKSLRYDINQLRKKNCKIVEGKTIEDINLFVEIYHETMKRVNASSDYFFDREYFIKFLKNKCFETKLLFAKINETIVAGAIFTINKNIMQYHLAGTFSEYSTLMPMKLIIEEARIIANAMNLEYLHLGGGVGGSDTDTLFHFKSGFSNEFREYKIWQYIADIEIYNSLSIYKKSTSNFFPLYRSN